MAFIRDYMAAGDPGHRGFRRFVKVPRFVRKFQPGRFARTAAQFIPGPIGTAAQYLGDPDTDWMGDPGRGRPKNKRKAAGAGPKVKAKAKRTRRGGGLGSALSGVGSFIGSHAGEIGGAAGALIGSVVPGVGTAIGGAVGGLAGEAAGELVPVGRPSTGIAPAGGVAMVPHGRGGKGPRMAHMATRKVDAWTVRPGHMNPTNVKALRRGVRRIEAFERVVKSVHKAYPRLAHAHTSRSSGGHKHGCKCFRCRKG